MKAMKKPGFYQTTINWRSSPGLVGGNSFENIGSNRRTCSYIETESKTFLDANCNNTRYVVDTNWKCFKIQDFSYESMRRKQIGVNN